MLHGTLKLCYLKPIVHQCTVASSGVRCINTLIVNCMLHIVTAFVSYCMNQDGAVHHNSL